MNVKSFVDVGCGFGYTTMALKELFPKAEAYATNFPEGCQWRLATIFSKKYNFSLHPNVKSINKQIDLIWATEYFEHIENPIEHVQEIIDVCNPKYFIIANAFGTHSIGHFDNYKVKNDNMNNYDIVPGKNISRLFDKHLKLQGFTKVKTKCWNNRPTYWKKIND